EQAASEGGEADGDRKRKRRRRRRGRSGEAHDGAPSRDDESTDTVQAAGESPDAVGLTDDAEQAGDETSEQDAEARNDLSADGERRPRRRGRRGGRRRRGGPEEGLVGSISDELGPTSPPEVTEAVADFDSAPPAPEQRVRTY